MSARVSFVEGLAAEADGRPLFDAGYRQLFGTSIEVHRIADLEWQRAGVDVALYLGGGHRLLIDEKVVREHIGETFVLLEIEHEYPDGRTAPGWFLKPQRCTHIAYAWLGTGRVWLLDVLSLRHAWGRTWADEFRAGTGDIRRATATTNRGGADRYKTTSALIPAERALVAVGRGLRTRVALP